MRPPLELPHADEDFVMLEKTWAEPDGLLGWISHVDHKSIGRRYLVTAFVYFLLGGLLQRLHQFGIQGHPGGVVVGNRV